MKVITLQKVDGKPGAVWYPLQTLNLPSPPTPPPQGQVNILFLAASLNHRDLFQRRALYPGIAFGCPILADGVGVVTAPQSSPLYNKRIVINPARGWISDPLAPESTFATLGASIPYPNGCLQEAGVFAEEECIEAPGHLSHVAAAALPLCGVTAWRAVVTKGKVSKGQRVLIMGIGGGVALAALQFCVALGAEVIVSSSSKEKIEKAMAMGAVKGLRYNEEGWERQIEPGSLDVVIDGAGGDIIVKLQKQLKMGARFVVYGMTTGPKMPFPMGAVMKNVDVLGSTMGSREEFKGMVRFVGEKKISPVVSKVVQGLGTEGLESLFEEMDKGRQFGKLVVKIQEEGSSRL